MDRTASTNAGSRFIAVMDHSGAISNPEGIDAEQLARYVETSGGIVNYPAASAISQEQFYQTHVDLLDSAALEQMVTIDEAQQINCRVLVEAANAPTTPRAENHLLEKGVKILPAILCNAGGVVVSYLEWKQNRQSEQWGENRWSTRDCKPP